MTHENANSEIIEIFERVESKYSDSDKHLIHFKSISNFIHHLIYNRKDNPKKNIKLQVLGEARIKKKLIEYLSIVLNENINRDKSFQLYDEYIIPIGNFMMEYYRFSGTGGKTKLVHLVIAILVGLPFDFLFSIVLSKVTVVFIPLFLLIAIIRMFVKAKERKIFGVFY